MALPAPLPPEALATHCDPASLPFDDTSALPTCAPMDVHPRAIEAARLGLAIGKPGYNIFMLGEAGSGRRALIERLLEKYRNTGALPDDWCYVFNFNAAAKPRLLRLPCGRGVQLRDDMQRFVEDVGPAISAAFESDDYRRRIESIQAEEKQREDAALRQLGHEAVQQGIALLRTPQGFMFAPLKTPDETYSSEEFAELPEEQQQALGQKMEAFHQRLHDLMHQFPHWRREMLNRIRAVNREVLKLAVGHLIEELRPRYADLPDVQSHLDAVLKDIVESGEAWREGARSEEELEPGTFPSGFSLHRYLVNLLVSHAEQCGRPIVIENHPTVQNLVGRIDHLVHMGTLVTNFTLIKAGALHRANGGFLVLDALKVLSQPYAWEALKRALKTREIRIESLAELLGLASAMQMEPEPAPLDVKVVLIGDRLLYYLLAEYDPDFPELFKINADLDSEMPRTAENMATYAQLLASLAHRSGLLPLSAHAVAKLIDHAARLAGDAERLTMRTRPLEDLMVEADHHARGENAARIESRHVAIAIEGFYRRHERLRKRYQEEILRGQLLIATEGLHVGQINGLAVITLPAASFAHPVRITATVRMGEGEIIDIEREVELGGPIHSKGVLILSSFLAARYGWATPLSLKASLVFEQSYGGVEGDSASLAELAALLSALSGIPIKQALAVTGSVNQFGVVQPIGGVNEKIEGFFEICAARGLTGEHGVIIPKANVCHLMLRSEILEAVRAGRFHIWAVENVDQALELLTGVPAGEPDEQGNLPEGSLNYQVALQLATFAELRQEYGQPKRRTKRKKKA
ncbi:MAG: AAA family ATPase [Rhodocyclaceae bacterium]|nr:AAA family ATPase [Rhodocyclaceae bacterium]